MVPASCCIIDEQKYPAIEPVDGHCIYVPTKYNSHWTQVEDTFEFTNVKLLSENFLDFDLLLTVN